MQQQQHLTDAQIERIEVVISELAKRGNAWGIAIDKQLLIGGLNMEARRRIVLGAYGQMYEAMLCINMAMTSTRTPAEILASLKESGGKHG